MQRPDWDHPIRKGVRAGYRLAFNPVVMSRQMADPSIGVCDIVQLATRRVAVSSHMVGILQMSISAQLSRLRGHRSTG
jgi:hypothetical protein